MGCAPNSPHWLSRRWSCSGWRSPPSPWRSPPAARRAPPEPPDPTDRQVPAAISRSVLAMSFFHYHGGELHAEEVPLARIAAAVGTPFYVYSDGALRAAYEDFAAAFAGLPAIDLLCAEGQLQPRRSCAPWRRLGAGADVVSEGELRRALAAGVPAGQHRLLRRRQDRAEMAAGARRRHPPVQRRVRCRSCELLNQVARERGRQARGRAARQSRCRCAHPRQDLHRQGREQVRHRARPGAGGLCRGGAAAGHRGRAGWRCISARSSPSSRPFAAAFAQDGGAGERIAAAGHVGPRARSRRRPRHRLSRRDRAARSRTMPRAVKETVGTLGLRLIFEPGRAHRRQCRRAGDPGIYVKDGVSRNFAHRRCGDERPDPAALYDA